MAVRKLRRSMGINAPDIVRLIQHELSDRDAAMIVDDYLQAVARRAPGEKGTQRRPGTVASRVRTPPLSRRGLGRDGPTSTDPSRN